MRQHVPDTQNIGTESGKAFGRFVYENGKLSYIINADGVLRAVYNDPQALTMIEPEININLYPGSGEYLKGFTREIHLKDHLGNVRAVFDYSKLQSENHYYPFGLPIHNLCASTAPEGKENRYLYNGKELQDDLGLNWMDYGARFYDAGIGRFHTQDAYAEKYQMMSPYHYAANNPIKFIDLNGDSVVYANPSTEEYIKQFIDKESKSYNKEFAGLINILDESETIYNFSDEFTSDDKMEAGQITTDGDQVLVEFSNNPDQSYGSKSNALFEEANHALQVENKELIANENGTFSPKEGTSFLDLEYDAKKFASKAPGGKNYFTPPDGYKRETQMQLIKRLTPKEAKSYLTDGIKLPYLNLDGSGYDVDYKPPYPNLKK